MSQLKALQQHPGLPGDLRNALLEADARIDALEAFQARALPMIEEWARIDLEREQFERELKKYENAALPLPHAGGDKPKG